MPVLVVSTLALSGCLFEAGEDPGSRLQERRSSTGDALSASEAAGLTPLWFPGLVYTYQVEHHPTGGQGLVDFVVLEGPGAGFTLDPVAGLMDDEGLLAWAVFWGLPVGPIDGEDYEPRSPEGPMDWFSFPIRAADEWEGKAPDGESLVFRAHSTSVVLPDGEKVVAFEVTGERNGTDVMGYTYTSQVGWFVSWWWDATGDGWPEVSLDLQEIRLEPELRDRSPRSVDRFLDVRLEGFPSGAPEDLAGQVEQWLEDLEERVWVEHGFEVPMEDEGVAFVLRFSGGPGLYEVNITSQEDGGRSWHWTGGEPGEAGEPAEHWVLDRWVPQDLAGDARLFVLAQGSIELVGFQFVPVEP